MQSYPLRVRGLKLEYQLFTRIKVKSYPLRVRGLKLEYQLFTRIKVSRILYGYVG